MLDEHLRYKDGDLDKILERSTISYIITPCVRVTFPIASLPPSSRSCPSTTTPCLIKYTQLGPPSLWGNLPALWISPGWINFFKGRWRISRSMLFGYSGWVNLRNWGRLISWVCLSSFPRGWWLNCRWRLRKNWWRCRKPKLLWVLSKRRRVISPFLSRRWATVSRCSLSRMYCVCKVETRPKWSACSFGYPS